MSFSLRSLSARRYRIEGDFPSIGDDAFAQRLVDKAFQPLTAHEERAFGWVTADNCLDARFQAGSVARGPCAIFSMRVDKRRVNGRLLRAMIDLEMRGRKKDVERDAEGAATGPQKGDGKKPARPRISRDEKQEIRRQITEELLRSTPPTMEVHPVLVYPREKIVLFGSLSKPSNEVFRTLFTDTFEVTLASLTPYHRALELLADRGGSEALGGLRRTDFGRAVLHADSTAVVPPAIAARASQASVSTEVPR
jgi:hypothetical protein